MTVRSKNVPQAPRLARLRDVVDAVARGSRDVDAVATATGTQIRDARYYLNAAVDSLSFIEQTSEGYRVTPLGRGLAASEPGSGEEQRIFAAAIRSSEVVHTLAGDLLGPRRPSLARVRRRMEQAGLAPSTADQRARALLSWREQLEPTQRSLDYGVSSRPRCAASLGNHPERSSGPSEDSR